MIGPGELYLGFVSANTIHSTLWHQHMRLLSPFPSLTPRNHQLHSDRKHLRSKGTASTDPRLALSARKCYLVSITVSSASSQERIEAIQTVRRNYGLQSHSSQEMIINHHNKISNHRLFRPKDVMKVIALTSSSIQMNTISSPQERDSPFRFKKDHSPGSSTSLGWNRNRLFLVAIIKKTSLVFLFQCNLQSDGSKLFLHCEPSRQTIMFFR